jgi:hypothetical protein
MDTRLMTADGFPRSDIDVAQSKLATQIYTAVQPKLLMNLKYAQHDPALYTSETTTRR